MEEKQLYFVVTDGRDYMHWDKRIGTWDSTRRFAPDCLLAYEDAEKLWQQCNAQRDEQDNSWEIEAFILTRIGRWSRRHRP